MWFEIKTLFGFNYTKNTMCFSSYSERNEIVALAELCGEIMLLHDQHPSVSYLDWRLYDALVHWSSFIMVAYMNFLHALKESTYMHGISNFAEQSKVVR